MSNRIAEIKSQLTKALQERRAELTAELESIDQELALLGDSPEPKGKKRGSKPGKRAGRPAKGKTGAHKDFTDAAELKGVLTKAGGKLNRKGFTDGGYSLKSAKAIAKAEPKTFGIQESGAQGSVWIK